MGVTGWLYEDGVGEARAALVEDGVILEAAVERPGPGPRHGAVLRARYGAALGKRGAATVVLDGAGEAVLLQVPPGVGPGGRFTAEVVREALPVHAALHRGREAKAPRVRVVPDDTPPGPGPTLWERIMGAGLPVRRLRTVDADLLEEAGWGEVLEEARTGRVEFPGGALLVEPTAGMTVIDVDGRLDPDALAVAGAHAAARAVRRLGIAGSIGVDLPSVAGREARRAAAEAFDAGLAGPFERTAVNGWGFLQAVRPRLRPSLMEVVGADGDLSAALALYRLAERDPRPGPVRLTAAPGVAAHPGRAAHDAELARRRGGTVAWAARDGLDRWAGHVHAGPPAAEEPDR